MKHAGFQAISAVVCMVAVVGCETQGKSGAVAGAGIGALAGQAIGRNTKSTLIGAAVGTGAGYIIGNEKDKKHAKEINEKSKTHNYTHSEVSPLGGTRWQLINIAPKDIIPAYASKFIEFRPYGRVITTTTNLDGSVDVVDERYRVVGDTLIVNKPGYLINARFGIVGDELIVSAEDFRAVLKRMR
jgi:hypothetical protein